MIYTVTFNPALDYIANTTNFRAGETNRTTRELMYPGGKGINVSLVLKNLGMKSCAVLFAAGFTGDELVRRLEDLQVATKVIPLKQGMTRINVKIRSEEMDPLRNALVETELNGMGPVISEEAMEELYQFIETLTDEDILVLSGSIPSGMPKDTYARILEKGKAAGKKTRFVVDATGKLLTDALRQGPFLIKPNDHELEEIFGVKMETKEDLIFYGKKLQEMGALNVLISMAGDGAVLIAENGKTYRMKPPKGQVKNSVGAGDSMVAGFLTGFLDPAMEWDIIKSEDVYEKAFRMGVCTGSASAFSDGMATKEEVKTVMGDGSLKLFVE